jgi:regulatory protein
LNTLRSRAIKLLARREHTRAELQAKLAAHGTPEEVTSVVNQLATSNLQSDTRFAESFIRAKASRSGSLKLRHSMLSKGLAKTLVDSQLAAADMPDELTRARALWLRKFATPPASAKEWARQARFLQSRGFSTDIIRQLLKESGKELAEVEPGEFSEGDAA